MQITHKGEQEPQWPGRPTALETSTLAVQGSSAMIQYNDYCQRGLFFHVFVSFSSNFLLLPNFMHQRSKDKRLGLVWRRQTPHPQERVSGGVLWGPAWKAPAGRFSFFPNSLLSLRGGTRIYVQVACEMRSQTRKNRVLFKEDQTFPASILFLYKNLSIKRKTYLNPKPIRVEN